MLRSYRGHSHISVFFLDTSIFYQYHEVYLDVECCFLERETYSIVFDFFFLVSLLRQEKHTIFFHFLQLIDRHYQIVLHTPSLSNRDYNHCKYIFIFYIIILYTYINIHTYIYYAPKKSY